MKSTPSSSKQQTKSTKLESVARALRDRLIWHLQLKLGLHPDQFNEVSREVFFSHAMAFLKRPRSVVVTETVLDEKKSIGRVAKRSIPVEQLSSGSEGFEILFAEFVPWHEKKYPQIIERVPATDDEKREAVHLLAQILREGQRSGILAGPRPSAKNRERRIPERSKNAIEPLTDASLKTRRSLTQAQAAATLGYKSTRQIRKLFSENKQPY